MPRKLTIDEVKERIREIHGDTITLDGSTYVNMNTKCRLIDIKYGEWWTSIGNIIYRKCGHRSRQNTLSIDEIKRRIKEIHGDVVVLDESTYINTITKARFIDKDYGEWWVEPQTIFRKHNHPKRANENRKKTMMKKYGAEGPIKNNKTKEKSRQTNLERYGVVCTLQNKEIQEKAKQTNLERYGVEYPMQDPEIALKCAKAQKNSYVLVHWKTNKEVICTAGYEKVTVEYLNINKIDYDWQLQAFKMPNGRTYRPDLYLPDQNLWIEIKGYFRGDAQEKWEWFHKEYPNSELWNKDKLKELKIL